MNSEKDKAIEDFLGAMSHAWAEMDLRTFQVGADLFGYDSLIAEPWTDEHTMPLIRAAASLPALETAKLFHNPSAIRGLFQFDVLMAKEARLGVGAYMQIFDFYSDVLRAITPDDPYTTHETNRIHSPSEISQMISQCESGDVPTARALGRMANACYSLSHGLYTDMNPQLVYDNFGPYYQKDGKLFVLKIFHNLRPVELWPETSALPVDGVDIGVLLEGVTMTMDATTHAVFTGNQVEGLRGWWCTADGKRLTVPEIDELRKQIEKMAIDVFQKTKAFTIPKRKEFYCWQKAWGYKKLFDKLGLDWRPPQSVLDAMKGDYLFDKWNMDPDTGALKCSVADLFDPRKEIPPEAFK